MSDAHLKVITDGSVSTAHLPTLCGNSDRGFYLYIAFRASSESEVEQVRGYAESRRDGSTPICEGCCVAFLANYEAVAK